jgi:hypothetical protein
MAVEDLSVVTRSVRLAMGESAGQFRDAASAHVGNLTKIVKDLARSFVDQRERIADLANNIEENAYETQQTNSKLERQTGVFQESLSLQTSMFGEMKNVSDGIRILNNSIEQLNNNLYQALVGPGGGSLLGGLTAAIGGLPDAIKAVGAFALGAAGVAAGGYAASQFAGKGVGETGSSSEAMSFFQSKGWSKEQAAGIVGNLQVESGKNLKTNAVGDNGQAYGIAQWHPKRQADFQRVMGIPISQSNFKQQLEFVQWELMNTEKSAGNMLKSASTAIEAAKAVDYGYERSTHQHLGQRMANAVALARATDTPQTTSGVTPKNEAMSSAPATTSTATPTAEHTPGGHHGIISGPMSAAEQGATQGGMPSGDIVALGKIIQRMGIRVSEHPSFGGVEAVHVKGSAHYRGEAIDVNAPGNVVEAQDPVWGKKFDELAAQLRSSGYKVIWRQPGHYNHLHAQLGGAPSGHEMMTEGGSTGPGTSNYPTTPGPEGQAQAQQVAPSADQALTNQALMSLMGGGMGMGMMGGMMGGGLNIGSLMGAMGGMGGNIPSPETIIPQAAGITPDIAQGINVPLGNRDGEMLQQLSESAMNNELMKETAIQKQVQQETAQEAAIQPTVTPSETPPNVASQNGIYSDAPGYQYNHPSDTGWPDWASMLGHTGYQEMSKIKLWG